MSYVPPGKNVERLIDWCPECDGVGHEEDAICSRCKGQRLVMIDNGKEVPQSLDTLLPTPVCG